MAEGTLGRSRYDRDRVVADLQALVRIPSITGSEEAVMAWAADALVIPRRGAAT